VNQQVQPTSSYIHWIRSLVGNRKIFLPFASVILRDDQGRILLQHRTDSNRWGLPGGILELGEDILACARRELLEETGLTAGELQLVGLYSDPKYDVHYSNGDRVQQYTLCFQGPVLGGELKPDGDEADAAGFFSIDEIEFRKLHFWYAEMISESLIFNQPVFRPPFTRENTVDQIADIRPLIGHALYHGVGAAAVVTDTDGNLLMTRRTDNDCWHFPGGYMHLGENAAHNVIREIWEETGLQIVPERILGVHSPVEPWIYPNDDQVQGIVTFFKSSLNPRFNNQHPVIDHTETCDAAWVAPDRIRDYPTHPGMAPVYEAILQHLDRGYFIL
jgi:8-oxo-dGTP pyrophosphatase MutT (NUDIX family)